MINGVHVWHLEGGAARVFDTRYWREIVRKIYCSHPALNSLVALMMLPRSFATIVVVEGNFLYGLQFGFQIVRLVEW